MLKIKWKLKCQKCEVGREGEREREIHTEKQTDERIGEKYCFGN